MKKQIKSSEKLPSNFNIVIEFLINSLSTLPAEVEVTAATAATKTIHADYAKQIYKNEIINNEKLKKKKFKINKKNFFQR